MSASAQGMDAHYRHCATTFALIHVDWDNGNHRQVDAYFVNTPPRLLKNASGRLICSASQPDA
ncbi:MAG: hypothetical protein QOI78_4668 [Actinomycetota bacterium]|jgi:hypothetical protein|nr:hypothetical protein [Actinomycetota bacterium]